MKAFVSGLFDKIRLVLVAISHWPIIEPIRETLGEQRTIWLLAGLVGFRLVPRLFTGLSSNEIAAAQVFVMAIALARFVGLQKEVWEEAKRAIASLPTTDAGYLQEFAKVFWDSLQKKPDADKAVTVSTATTGSKTLTVQSGQPPLSADPIPQTG